MQSQNRRYVFIGFDDLKRIKFKKLERVCSRIYVLIDPKDEAIPFALISQTQKIGRRLKWIPVSNMNDEDMTYQIAFLMGKLHQKVQREIEFAILSNDSSLDPLVNFINIEGRNCLRVKRMKTEIEEEITESFEKINQEINEEAEEEEMEEFSDEMFDREPVMQLDGELVWVEETARETVKRLIRSGNRPSDLSLLKSYILLHNQEMTDNDNIEKILERLQETKEILIENQDVIYNF